MANEIAYTAAEIRALQDHGAIVRAFKAGGTVYVGQIVYIAADGDVELADGNGSLDIARAVGVVVASYDGETTITAGNPASVCVFGPVSGFSAMTPGQPVFVSDTIGRFSSVAGTVSRILGYAETAGIIFVHPQQNVTSSA